MLFTNSTRQKLENPCVFFNNQKTPVFFFLFFLFFFFKSSKDLGQYAIQSAQILTACGLDNAKLTTIVLGLNQTFTFSAPSKIKILLKILHNYARTLGFRGWGYFL